MQQEAQYQEEPPAPLSPPGAHFQNRNGAKGPEYQFERENTHPTAADAIFRSLFSALVSSSLLFMPQRGRDGCCVARLQLQEVAPFSKVIPETGGRECWQSSTVKSLPQLFFFFVTVSSVTNRKHAGYQCHDLKGTFSLLCPSTMKQSTMKRFPPSSGPILKGILK